MVNVKRLSEIEAKPIVRNKTWFSDLDILYGTSDLLEHNIGMPKGKISLWAGESGVGKSRLCIEVSKRFSTKYSDGKVLYFQTESTLSDFASWANDTNQYDRIFCSGEDRIDKIIQIIYQVRPHIVFVDSVNEIEEFENGTKKETRRLIKGINGKPGLAKVAQDTGAHIILLGQVNQDGKTIKGGTSLPHAVDIALNVLKADDFRTTGVFKVEKGVKHRHGSGETVAWFKHTDEGVIEHVTVEQKIDPNDRASMYFGEDILSKPFYYGDKLWTIRRQKHYLKVKAERVASGEIKVDENGRIIPGKEKRSLLTRLNEGVENIFCLS